jgi:hypothetical protein
MSYIYYVCVAENQKILFESGESAKYGRYAELALSRIPAGIQTRCFEVDSSPEVLLTALGDLSTTWIAITDTEVQLSLPFTLLTALQQPWRSMNRPLQFGRLIDEKIALYTSTDAEKQAIVMEEIQQLGSVANDVKLEPLSTLLKKKENLDELLVRVDSQISNAPEERSREKRQNMRTCVTVAAGIVAIAWSIFYIACGLQGERCVS